MIIKPAPVGDLTFANTEYESMYGDVVVNWKKEDKGATFHIEIPVNTTAKVYLPATIKEVIQESGVLAENTEGTSFLGTEENKAVGNYVIFNVSSGIYDFKVNELPVTQFLEPLNDLKNLAKLGRINASSMFIQTEKLPVFEAFRVNDGDKETRWLATETKNQYVEVEWVKPQIFNQVIIDEFEDNITSYKIQYWEDNEWKDIVVGTDCGADKTHDFNAVTTTKCRLLIMDAEKAPSVKELRIFNK